MVGANWLRKRKSWRGATSERWPTLANDRPEDRQGWRRAPERTTPTCRAKAVIGFEFGGLGPSGLVEPQYSRGVVTLGSTARRAPALSTKAQTAALIAIGPAPEANPMTPPRRQVLEHPSSLE
jgi:hypothetical protein